MKRELVRVGSEPDRKVDALVAFIAIHPKTGMEGIMSAGESPDKQLPMVFTAGHPMFEMAMELARQSSRETGYPIEVRRYECVSREVLK